MTPQKRQHRLNDSHSDRLDILDRRTSETVQSCDFCLGCQFRNSHCRPRLLHSHQTRSASKVSAVGGFLDNWPFKTLVPSVLFRTIRIERNWILAMIFNMWSIYTLAHSGGFFLGIENMFFIIMLFKCI